MKIKKRGWEEYAVYGLIILVIAAVAFSSASFFNNFFNVPKLIPTSKQYGIITTGTTGKGDVEISLAPSLQGEQLAVTTTFNTHSVDLSQYDLRQLVSLELSIESDNSAGEIIRPLKAFSLSGHHSSGQIIFNMGALADSFTITITGIPALPERKYTWKQGGI